LGEQRHEVQRLILEKTDILDYMCQVLNYSKLTPTLLKFLPWLCSNIVRATAQVEVIQIVLRVIHKVSEQLIEIKSQKKRDRILKDILQVLVNIVLGNNEQ